MKRPHAKTIRRAIWNLNQSWHLESFHQSGAHLLRVRITHNAYIDQSHATVERWNGAWQYLASIPAPEMSGWAAEKKLSYVSPEQDARPHLTDDETYLTDLAIDLLKHA